MINVFIAMMIPLLGTIIGSSLVLFTKNIYVSVINDIKNSNISIFFNL